jgi:hypothetical protein
MFGAGYLVSTMVISMLQGAGSAGAFLLIVPLYLVLLGALLVQFVAIAQFALGLAPNPGWINIPPGKTVLRLVGAWLLVMLIMIGMWLALILVGAIIGGGLGFAMATAGKGAAAIAGLITGVVMIVTTCAFTYGMVRLTFLLLPVVVAERVVGIKRAWRLGKGNFWRMLGVFILTLLPLIALEFLVLKFFLPPMPTIAPGTPPAALQAATMAWEAGMFARMRDNWYIVYPVGAVVAIVVYGILIAAQCFAYRALVPADAEADAFI